MAVIVAQFVAQLGAQTGGPAIMPARVAAAQRGDAGEARRCGMFAAMPSPAPHAAFRQCALRGLATGTALMAAPLVALLLAACGSAPKGGRDGPAAEIPADLASVPDAEPRIEPIRPGGANKPYEVLGQNYTPLARDVPLRERGLASWYGRKFHGRKTASGELYDMHAMTAAHKTMPLPSYARVRNPANGREVIVRVNDRGPFVAGRVIDLSYTAALKLGVLRGVAPVEVERLTFEDIRTGAWRRESGPAATATAVAAAALRAAPAAAPDAPAPAAAPDVPAVADPAAEPVRAEADVALAVSMIEPAVSAATAVAPPASPAPATPATPATTLPGTRAAALAARGWWVQLGAFRERGGAEGFRERVAAELDWIAPMLALFSEAPLWRLQAGPYPSRDEAQGAAQRVRESLQLVPLVVEKR